MRVALMFPLLVLSKSIVCFLSLVKLSPPLLVISSPSHKVASKDRFFHSPLSRILLKRRCSRLNSFWQHPPLLSFACPSLDVRNTLDPICVSDVLCRSLCSFRDCFSCAVSWVWCGNSLAALSLSLVSSRRANFSFLSSHLESRRTHRWLLGSLALIASPLLIGKVAAIQGGP